MPISDAGGARSPLRPRSTPAKWSASTSLPRAVSFCADAARRNGAGNVSFLLADVRTTGLPGGRFDAAYAADLFEHLYPKDSRLACEEAHRTLKPGGVFVVWMPCRSHFVEVLKNRNIVLKADPTHVDYKSKSRTILMLMNAGFRILRAVYAECNVYFTAWTGGSEATSADASPFECRGDFVHGLLGAE